MRKNVIWNAKIPLVFMLPFLLISCGGETTNTPSDTLSVGNTASLTSSPTQAPSSTAEPYPPILPQDNLEPYPLPVSEYLTAQPTRTFPPTWTPSVTPVPPTATSLPTIIPPIQSIKESNLLRLSHDALFITSGALKIWRSQNGEIESLLDGISAKNLSISADGRKVVVANRRTMYPDLSDIYLVEIGSGQILNLVEGVLSLQEFSISPNGRWLVYMALPEESEVQSGKAPGFASLISRTVMGGGYPLNGIVYLIDVDKPEESIELGYCGRPRGIMDDGVQCYYSLLWSLDSTMLSWADYGGVWLADIETREIQMIFENDEQDPLLKAPTLYYPHSWSASGRFLVIDSDRSDIDRLYVLDMETGRLARIPVADWIWELQPSYTEVQVTAWLPDDSLVVVQPGENSDVPPRLIVWQLSPDGEDLLVEDKVFEIEILDNVRSNPISPHPVNEDEIVFAIASEDNTNYLDRGLYKLQINTGKIEKLVGLPPGPAWEISRQLVWSPSGDGAFLRYDYDAPTWLYLPAYGEVIYDLNPELDTFSCCVTWLPKD